VENDTEKEGVNVSQKGNQTAGPADPLTKNRAKMFLVQVCSHLLLLKNQTGNKNDSEEKERGKTDICRFDPPKQ
jgi:hypothetical protein